MYQINLRRQVHKELESISTDYAHLIAQHIDSLEENPRPPDSKVTWVIRCGSARIVCYTTLTIKQKLLLQLFLPNQLTGTGK